MDYDNIISTFKSVIDIDKTIETFNRKAKSLRKKAIAAPTLADKLAINKEIKIINEIVFKLKFNYFQLEDGINRHV